MTGASEESNLATAADEQILPEELELTPFELDELAENILALLRKELRLNAERSGRNP